TRQADLTQAMFDCLMGYADASAKVVDNEPGNFNRSHVEKLLPVLDRYLEARRVKKDLVVNAKSLLNLKIGYIYVNIGHSYRTDDNAKAIENYRMAQSEFKQISPLFRERLSAQDRENFMRIETALEQILKGKN